MAVSKRLRFEILRRDGFRCRYCGLPSDETGAGLTVDHVTPSALGGSDDPSNLVAACRDCNSGKTSSSPDEHQVAQVADDAVRWAAAIRQVDVERQSDLHAFESVVKAFARTWDFEELEELPRGWRDTIRRFCAQGLTQADLLNFLDVAAGKTSLSTWKDHARFRYFCGVCNNEIRDRQNAARALLAPPIEPTPPVIGPGWRAALHHLGRYLWEDGIREGSMGQIIVSLNTHGGMPIDEVAPLLHGWDEAASADSSLAEDVEAYLHAIGGGHSPADAFA